MTIRRGGPLVYGTLALACLLSGFPIYWMFVIATRSNDAIGSSPPPLLPGGDLGDNIGRLLANDDANFGLGLVNSFVVAGTVTLSVVFFSSLAGFAFAKLRFRGQHAMLLAIIGTMMVPVQLGIIPLYMLMVQLGWAGELQAVIFPFLVTGFGVFLMRQYAAEAVPDELIAALRPAAAVLGLFTFMQTWNEFFWPYAVLTQENPTVQLSLAVLSDGYFTDYSQVFAGTVLATLPLLVVFVLFGRQIIGGIMEGALKA
jgi:cellobiose transport system permease protein